MNKLFIAISFFILLGCSNKTGEAIPHKKTLPADKFVPDKFIFQTDTATVEIKSYTYEPDKSGNFFFRDANYIVSSCDLGEWGQTIFFTGSTSGRKTGFPLGRIFSFGKTDSTYLFFSEGGHGTPHRITIIKEPGKLPFLPDSVAKLCTPFYKYPYLYLRAIRVLRRGASVTQIDDDYIHDTTHMFIGIFTKGNHIYAVQTGAPGSGNNLTVLSRLNDDFRTFTVVDTLLNFFILPRKNAICPLYKDLQMIGFSYSQDHFLKKGYFFIAGDTITTTFSPRDEGEDE